MRSRWLASALGALMILTGCATTGGSPTQTQTGQTVTATLAGLGACSAYAKKHHDAATILVRLDQADAALTRGIGFDALKTLLLGSVNPDDALYFTAGLAIVEPLVKDRNAKIVLGSQQAAIIKALMDGCRSAAMISATQTAGGSGADPRGKLAGGGSVDPGSRF